MITIYYLLVIFLSLTIPYQKYRKARVTMEAEKKKWIDNSSLELATDTVYFQLLLRLT